MKKATKIALTLVLIAVLLVVVSSFLWEEREPELKVAILHFGPIGDYGWTYEAHLGAQKMAETLPYVELSEREEACGPDAPQIMREYAEAGYKVIFCHSWDFGEDIGEVASDYPDVVFMWGAGVEKKAPNAGMYFARMYEGRFLAGMVAGAMTKTNKIGYAAALPTSEVVRGIDAFAKGVALVNPDAKVYVEWIGEWYNPPKEKEVTLSLIDKGCDIITHHSDSNAPGEAAEERGVYFISYHSDMRRFAPDVFLTGVVWNWTPIMTDIVKAVREGTWDEHPGQDWWYGLAEGGVRLAPFSDSVPDDVREMVEEKEQEIIEGEFEIFPGMTDEELREIYYLEPNVVGELLISVNVGQEFVIALDENPSTGYSWQEEFDDSFLELVADKYEPPPEPKEGEPPIVGAPGTRIFEFKALKEGQTEITTILKRPWEEEFVESRMFTVNIEKAEK